MHRVLVSRDDLLKAIRRKNFLWKMICSAAMPVLGLTKLNKAYNLMYRASTEAFIDAMFQCNNNTLKVSPEKLDMLPAEGSFAVVSNHPFGGWDGVALIKTISEVRPDIKFLVNFLIGRIEPLKPNIIEVNPFENRKQMKSNFQGLKTMHRHVSQGHPIGFFPAGEVSTFYRGSRRVMDRAWQANIVKFIQNNKLCVVPVYIPGGNSAWFHRLGKIHPLLRTIRLPGELLRLTNTEISLHFGKPVNPSIYGIIKDTKALGSFLKMRSYAIGEDLKQQENNNITETGAPVIDAIDIEALKTEIDSIRSQCFLFRIEQYECFLEQKSQIPQMFTEISRLREVSFREVGEGTGNSADSDAFDEYYRHLFVWDSENQKLVGSYRIGFGEEIMQQYGPNGFYTSTLFTFTDKFHPIMRNALELGRSFVAGEYRRKSSALFILWKGIVYTLMKNPQYRYIFGPASISSHYNEFAKILMVEFFKRNHGDSQIEKQVGCRNKFTYTMYRDLANILDYCGNDIRKIDRVVEEFDASGWKIPVLFKKYLSQGARIVAFNVDPEFNNAIDGLILGDIKDIPIENIQSFAKEIEAPELLERFA